MTCAKLVVPSAEGMAARLFCTGANANETPGRLNSALVRSVLGQ